MADQPNDLPGAQPAEPDADERAAMRAFLQRCEVRLSTMHRVATALLSGAGILVLLPAVERDAVMQVLRALLEGPVSVTRGLLVVSVSLSIVLALTVLWLVVVELTRFYFHSNHVVHADGEVFTPRFTLTGLRLPSDELGAVVGREYTAAHAAPDSVALLVPGNERARQRIDAQLAAYPGLVRPTEGAADADLARAEAMFELAASKRRTLVEEVTKIEYGMVRHMLRLQVIVLRYVKALLVVVVTAVAAFASAAAVNSSASITAADERWIAATMVIWAPLIVLVVSSPVRWLASLLRSEGAAHTAVEHDTELTQLERVAARIAAVAWLAAFIAAVMLVVDHEVSSQGRVAFVTAIYVSITLVVVAVRRRSRAMRT